LIGVLLSTFFISIVITSVLKTTPRQDNNQPTGKDKNDVNIKVISFIFLL
jgi:hypothetical protein